MLSNGNLQFGHSLTGDARPRFLARGAGAVLIQLVVRIKDAARDGPCAHGKCGAREARMTVGCKPTIGYSY